jgi:hypothetical protein
MRRGASDDCTKTNQSIVPARGGQALRDTGYLKAARDPEHVYSFVWHRVEAQPVPSAGKQSFTDEVIEAGDDDSDPKVCSVQTALKCPHGRFP